MSLVGTFDVGPGIRNSIYVGGKADAKDRDKLTNRWKVTHILNVTPAREANITAGVPNYFETTTSTLVTSTKPSNSSKSSTPATRRRQFVYLRIPLYDSATSVSILDKEKDRIINFISRGLCHGNVLVHCHHGVSRSVTCVALYLISKRGMSLEDAMAMIRRRRPEARPIPAFLEYLQAQEGRGTDNASVPGTAAATKTTTLTTTTTGEGDKGNDQINGNDQTVDDDVPPTDRRRTMVPLGPSRGPLLASNGLDPTIITITTTTSKKRPRGVVGPTGRTRRDGEDHHDDDPDDGGGGGGTSSTDQNTRRRNDVLVGPSLPPPPPPPSTAAAMAGTVPQQTTTMQTTATDNTTTTTTTTIATTTETATTAQTAKEDRSDANGTIALKAAVGPSLPPGWGSHE